MISPANQVRMGYGVIILAFCVWVAILIAEIQWQDVVIASLHDMIRELVKQREGY